MKAKDLRQKKPEELTGQIQELQRELIKINAQAATGTTQGKGSGSSRNNKRMIARIKTILTEKERGKKQ